MYRQNQTLGMPRMLGVCDMLSALGDTVSVWCTARPNEADMTEKFWRIPKGKVAPSLNSLFALLE